MIKVSDLSFGFSEKPLYKGVSFSVGKKQKIGLVGPNGAGKSTLLSLIQGEESPMTGKIEISGKISMVPQEIRYDPKMEVAASVRDYVDPDIKFGDFEIRKMFSGLELSVELNQNPKTLSGGQKTKLALARALLERPEILLLDEPTNFMDVGGKAWVMRFLSEYEGSVIVISHDLDLMDSSIDKILEINTSTLTIDEYKGTYKDYLKLKKEREVTLKKQIIVKKKHIKQMEEGLKKMARFTSKKGVKRRIHQQRRIEKERENLPLPPPEIAKISLKLPEPTRVGEIPIKTNEIYKSYGDLVVLKDLNFTIIRGQKIALVGPNGTGKSTFIKILVGDLKPDSGEVVRDQMLDVGYYTQEFELFNFNDIVLKTFCEKTKKDENYARSFLGRFLIKGDKVYQTVGSLSGGEKTRLSIAILTASSKNLLILDEPTTYLDVMSQRIILEALKLYKGTMIFVSHTPEFVKELMPEKVFLFPEQRLTYWDESILNKVEEV